jgi:hypothetical protein
VPSRRRRPRLSAAALIARSALALALGLAIAAAEPAGRGPELAALFADQEYEAVIAAADRALAGPRLPVDERARVRFLRGAALAVLGRDDEATADFVRLLADQPLFVPPADTSPRVLAVYEPARARWQVDREAALALELGGALAALRLDVEAPAAARGGRPLPIAVALADPAGVAATLELRHRRRGERTWSARTVAAGSRASLGLPAQLTESSAPYQLELYVEAIHGSGVALTRRGTADHPLVVDVAAGRMPRPRPIYRRWWFWAGVGVVAVTVPVLIDRARDVGPQSVVGTRR